MPGYDYTRQQMEEILATGGSLLVDGRLVQRLEELPTPADFISTPAEKAATQEEIKAQIKKLNEDLSKVTDKEVTSPIDLSKVTDKEVTPPIDLTPPK